MRVLVFVALALLPGVFGWWEIGSVNQTYAIPPITFDKACLSASDCFSYLCNNRGIIPYVAFRWVSDSIQVNISKVYTPSVVSTSCVECASSYGLYNFSTTTPGKGTYISKTTPQWGNVCSPNSITCSFVMTVMSNVPSVNTIIFSTITNGAQTASYPFTTDATCSAAAPSSTAASNPLPAASTGSTTRLPSNSAGGRIKHFISSLLFEEEK